MPNTSQSEIRVLQLNICGLSERSAFCLNNYINHNKADVVFLSEVKCTNCDIFTNYSCETKANYRNIRQGGVSLLAHNRFSIDRQRHLEDTNVDALFAIITIHGQRILVCSVYIPPSSHELLTKFLSLINQALLELKGLNCTSLAVFGDFNARLSDWGDHSDNAAGKSLSNFVDSHNLMIADKFNGYTFLCDRGGSRIDLAITTCNLFSLITNQYTDPDVELYTGAPHRGHVPVWTLLNLNHNITKSVFVHNWSNTDWSQFEAVLDSLTLKAVPATVSITDPHILWQVTKQLLINARDQVVPQKNINYHSKPYWTRDLTSLSKAVRSARKSFKYRSTPTNRAALDRAKEAFNVALDNAIKEHIQKQATSLNDANSASFWTRFKRTFYKSSSNERTIGTIIDQHGTKIVHDKDKASLLYNDIFNGDHLKGIDFDDAWKNTVENSVKYLPLSDLNSGSLNVNISADEIQKALTKVKCSNKSMDSDGIHPLMLKHCGNQFPVILLKLFNGVLTNHTWPWNIGNVIFLRKQGKPNYHNTSSFRPITITSYVGKTFERTWVT